MDFLQNLSEKIAGKIRRRAILFRDTISNRFIPDSYRLVYVVEISDWAIKWDGIYITRELNKQKLIKSLVRVRHDHLNNKIIHYGSLGCFIVNREKLKDINKHVVNWYHIFPNDQRIKYIPLINQKVDKLRTSNKNTAEFLLNHGLEENKLVQIPIGVDLKRFGRADDETKQNLKKKLNLPQDKIIIGSFQKDGMGWEEGDEPIYRKGPDAFCDVIEGLSKRYPLHILLAGPARGYVKKRLEKANISYSHRFLRKYWSICDLYKVLDLYIITSRSEGGPKAITEGLASGVPIISTKVGMAEEVIESGLNGLLCSIDDVEALTEAATSVIENRSLKENLIQNGLKTAKLFSWSEIAKQHYEKIYSQLLQL